MIKSSNLDRIDYGEIAFLFWLKKVCCHIIFVFDSRFWKQFLKNLIYSTKLLNTKVDDLIIYDMILPE